VAAGGIERVRVRVWLGLGLGLAACKHGCRAQTYSGCLPGPSGSVTFSHLRHVLVRPVSRLQNIAKDMKVITSVGRPKVAKLSTSGA